MQTMFLVINTITVVSLLLAIIYTAGVVWRVEMKLDTSYKFFLGGIVFLLAAEILDLFVDMKTSVALPMMVDVFRALFSLSFLTGVLFMRDIVRSLDGEMKK